MGKAIVFTIMVALSNPGLATEMVYKFVNPSFGGSGLNGNYLINNANAQNGYEDPDIVGDERTELEKFNDLLQRSILNRLASVISGNIIGPGGDISPGYFETTDFTIDVVDLGNGVLRITTTDKNTGETTVFEIENDI